MTTEAAEQPRISLPPSLVDALDSGDAAGVHVALLAVVQAAMDAAAHHQHVVDTFGTLEPEADLSREAVSRATQLVTEALTALSLHQPSETTRKAAQPATPGRAAAEASPEDVERAAAAVDLLARQAREAERALALEVRTARRVGLSWRQIGNAIGVTRQAAQQRYGLKDRRSVAHADRTIPGT